MKLILSGDIHIGRSSSRLPSAMAASPDVRATAAWDRLVDLTLREQADALLLAGDIADQDNQFWEAIGPLKRGIERLADAGVRTVAVAGNHDHAILPRLASLLPATHFTLLGDQGGWQRVTLQDRLGRDALHVDGWSFTAPHCEASPLEHYDLPADATLPTLGMIHGDLDAPRSRYAPLALTALAASRPAAWLLGHVHAPSLRPGPPWVLYPGSPQALDPGEPGPHGAWATTVEQGRLTAPRLIPLSSVWYDTCILPLDGLADADALPGHVVKALDHHTAKQLSQAGASLRHLRLRVTLTGPTPLAGRIASLMGDIAAYQRSHGQVEVSVERLNDHTLPAIDLADLARRSTAPGATARLLLELDKPQPGSAAMALIRQTRQRLSDVARQSSYALLPATSAAPSHDDTQDDDVARHHLRQQATRLLAHLLATQEDDR